MKYCKNCGNQLSDSAAFCGNCGTVADTTPGTSATQESTTTQEPTTTQEITSTPEASTNQESNSTQDTTTAQESPVMQQIPGTQGVPFNSGAFAQPANDKNRKIGIIAFIAIVILAFILLYMLIFRNLFGGSYKTPVKNIISAIENQDIKKLYKALPDYQVKELKEQLADYYDGDIDEFWSSSMMEDVSIDYEISDKEKLTKDELSNIRSDIKDYYDEKVKVSAGYELEVEFTIEMFGMEEESTTYMTVVKMDGKWVVYDSGSIF